MATILKEFCKKTLRGILTYGKKSEIGVIMAGGFERAASSEKKFKALADLLNEKKIPSLRFDYYGCGISDGNFTDTSVEKIEQSIVNAAEILREIGCKKIILVAHSLSCCAIPGLLNNKIIIKSVAISPAFNQKDLLRFWFSANKNKDKTINWNNYKNFFSESDFIKDCKRKNRMTKLNYISSDYYLENMNMDYAEKFINKKNILHIHGENDEKVPLQSVNIEFEKTIFVKNGDHDLERPDMARKWLKPAVNFIQK